MKRHNTCEAIPELDPRKIQFWCAGAVSEGDSEGHDPAASNVRVSGVVFSRPAQSSINTNVARMSKEAWRGGYFSKFTRASRNKAAAGPGRFFWR